MEPFLAAFGARKNARPPPKGPHPSVPVPCHLGACAGQCLALLLPWPVKQFSCPRFQIVLAASNLEPPDEKTRVRCI